MYVWYICTHCVYGVECMHMLYVSMCVCLLVVLTQTQSTAFVCLLLLGLQVCVLPYRVLGITLRALLMQQVLYELYHLLALKLKF